MRLLVPAYFYSTDPAWDALIAGAGEVQVDAIINPHNGIGEALNADYYKLCIRLRKAGVRVLGYISTRYGERPKDDVVWEMNAYEERYGVWNFFLDEAATSPDHKVGYYKEIYDLSGGLIVLNHGTVPDEAYHHCGDILVIFEKTYAKHTLEKFPGWIKRYPKNRFAQIIHSAPDWNRAKRALAKAGETSGYVYVTDDVLENPYDQIPSYWSRELKACK